jgi:hypothetical protein
MRKDMFPNSDGPLSVNRPEPVEMGNDNSFAIRKMGDGRTNHGGVVKQHGSSPPGLGPVARTKDTLAEYGPERSRR